MWSCFGFALSISGLYATIMATFTYPLHAGGAASVVWCWLIGGGGALALALSIAEIASAYPTSGKLISAICPTHLKPCHLMKKATDRLQVLCISLSSTSVLRNTFQSWRGLMVSCPILDEPPVATLLLICGGPHMTFPVQVSFDR